MAEYFGPGDYLLLASELASLFRVAQRTVDDWRLAGRLESRMTPGNQARFSYRQVCELLGVEDLPVGMRLKLTVPLR